MTLRSGTQKIAPMAPVAVPPAPAALVPPPTPPEVLLAPTLLEPTSFDVILVSAATPLVVRAVRACTAGDLFWCELQRG